MPSENYRVSRVIRRDLFRLSLKNSRFLTILVNILRLSFPSKYFWTWNLYGLGSSMRKNLGLSPWSRLHIGSDHGIALSTEPLKEEIESPSNFHVTWSTWRENLPFPDNRVVIRVQHPWIPFRKRGGFQLSPSPSGTLSFLPHSVPGQASEKFDVSSYIDSVLALPSKFHPVVFCIHSHDITRELVDKISASGCRVTTVGNSLHPDYVNRFYKLVSQFEYATSPTAGSQLFYCEEFGLKYFLYPVKETNPTTLANYKIANSTRVRLLELESLFSLENLGQEEQKKREVVSNALSLDLGHDRNFGYQKLKEAIKG